MSNLFGRRTWCAAFLLGACAFGSAGATTLQFELIAGGAMGDGGQATNAHVQDAEDLAYDSAGNLYVTELHANRIRRITPSGTITTIVGGGARGFGGDGGLAINAGIAGPRGLAFDAVGNLYFVDSGNARIRRIAVDGKITTFAGSGSPTSSGDGGPALQAGFNDPDALEIDGAGNLYVSEVTGHRVRRITPAGIVAAFAGTGAQGNAGDGGPATSALLDAPMGMDIDSAGNLYIADLFDGIRKVAPDGTITSVVTSSAEDMVVDASGALYYVNDSTCTLVKVFGTSAVALAGNDTACRAGGDGGPASAATLGAYTSALVLDPSGNIVFTDYESAIVRRYTVGSATLQRVAGTGLAFAEGRDAVGAPLSMLRGVAVDATGTIAFADEFYAQRYLTRTPDGKLHVAQSLGGLAHSVAFRSDGQGFTLDRSGSSIRTLDGASAFFLSGMRGRGLAADGGGNLYVADYTNHVIRKFDLAGNATIVAGQANLPGSTGDGGPATLAKLNSPTEIAVDAAGNVYVTEGGRIRRIGTDGVITFVGGIAGATVSPDGTPAASAVLGLISGIAVDDSGVYFAAGDRVRRINPDGAIETLQGLDDAPMGIALRNGVLYVTSRSGRVWRSTVSSVVTRPVAFDFNGDGVSDILWRNVQTGANVAWKSANSTKTQAVTGVTQLVWKIVGQGDFDGDGRDDLFWRNTQTGANTIWRSADNTTQTATTGVTDQNWVIAGVGDFNKDGKSDVVWRNAANGQNALWRSGNASTQTGMVAITDRNWKIVGVADFNGDGASDLLWRHATTGANAIWRSGNYNTPQSVTGVTNVQWKVQGVGDFDGDGRADIFWRNTTNGQDVLWLDANGAWTRAVPTVAVAWKVVAVADYDGDGRADILWRNTSTGANTIWRSGNSNLVMPVAAVPAQAWTVTPAEFQP